MSEILTLTSHAKLNWVLYVGPPRPDGYHSLLTVFQELELGEQMQFSLLEADECILEGFPPDIPDSSNLVNKAWQLMRSRYSKVRGMRVRIDKSLPQGGGLGGGSSNAACTLNAVNTLNNLGLTPDELEKVAGELGSDVAFFIQGGTAEATGRGEILTQVDPAPKYHLVLIFPPERMVTADGYRLLDEIPRLSPSQHTLSEFHTAIRSGSPDQLARTLHNDFELVAEKFEWFRRARTALEQAGVLKVLLCGSGSTVAGLCEDEESAQQIALHVRGIPTYTWPAST